MGGDGHSGATLEWAPLFAGLEDLELSLLPESSPPPRAWHLKREPNPQHCLGKKLNPEPETDVPREPITPPIKILRHKYIQGSLLLGGSWYLFDKCSCTCNPLKRPLQVQLS